MAAMKPRTGDGPMEVAKEGRGIVMRVPVDGGGRLVVEMNATFAPYLNNDFMGVVGGPRPKPRSEVRPGACPGPTLGL